MERKRVKPNVRAKTARVNTMACVDRISKLPEPIIHHILSFVPTIDVVRMSLLSKHWRRVWYSIPTLDFSYANLSNYFPSRGRKGFYEFLEICLRHRKACMRYISNSVVTRFKLHIEYNGGSADLDKWLVFAFQSNIEELDLRTKPHICLEDVRYCLPEAVLNSRSLSVLKLQSLNLDGSFLTICLPALKYLSLVAVKLCDEVLHNILSGCPSLEKFLLRKCTSLSNPRIPSISLKFLEWTEDWSCNTVHVEAMNLQSFVYGGLCTVINLSACPEVRNPSLLLNFLNDNSLENMIVGLPLLENLSLIACDMLKHITFRGQNLKNIRLQTYCNGDEALEATIETPNLDSFWYEGHTKFSLSMKSPTHLLSGKFRIDRYPKISNKDLKFIDLITFLTNINLSWKSLELHVDSEKDLMIPENLRRICRSPLPDLKHLKVKTLSRSMKQSELKDALYWISPSLETLTITDSLI